MGIIYNIQFGEEANGVYIEADAMETDLFDDRAQDGFRWVQTVMTNDPMNGISDTVDQGQSSGLTDPFYYRTPASDWEPGHFEDHPRRPIPNPGDTTTWRATLTRLG
jgi:hypothetical protein